MKNQAKGGSISTLLLSVIDVGDTQPPLAFNPTILLTSQSPLGSTQTTGLLLCDSDVLFRRIKLPNQPTIDVFKAGPLIVVLEATKLYISTSYSNIFNQINITLTSASSLTVNGEQIIPPWFHPHMRQWDKLPLLKEDLSSQVIGNGLVDLSIAIHHHIIHCKINCMLAIGPFQLISLPF